MAYDAKNLVLRNILIKKNMRVAYISLHRLLRLAE